MTELRTAFPATLEAVEKFFAEFRLKRQGLLDPVNGFAVELLLREALTNAVAHGCHADPRKLVRCILRLKGERVLIIVQDDGDGFNWRGAGDHPAPFTDCSGRGAEILRKYANHVRYNDRGNAVAMIKRMSVEENTNDSGYTRRQQSGA